jgi:hypothetical protein
MSYVFTCTASGDRTNILASFPLWDKEMFLASIKEGMNGGRYRYGKIGGYMHLLKEMSLEEFHQVFSPELFTTQEITRLFRVDISAVYGEHAIKAKIKALPKKELERGCVYKDVNGTEFLYFGEVEKTIDKTYKKNYPSQKKPVEVEKGYGFEWYYKNRGFNANITILKSIKKLVEKVEGIKIEFKPEYVLEDSRGYYEKEYWKTTLKLL